MVELPAVEPVELGQAPSLTREDLVAVLTGLAPGYYLSRDLLPRVNVWLADKGRDPATVKSLGEALVRVMKLDRRRAHGNVRAYHVTPEAVAGRDWFKA